MPIAPTRFTLFSADQLQNLPPPTWLIRNIMEERSQVMIYGPSGSGKSFVALDMALAIATGSDWQGHPVTQGPIIYIAGEGGRGIDRRVRAWMELHQRPLDKLAHFILTAPQLAQKPDVDALITDIQMAQVKPQMIVLDTFARTFVGGDENSSQDTGVWVAAASRLQDVFACTVLLVHHSGVAAQERARGSSAIKAAMDTEIRITRVGKLLTLTCTKQKDAEEFEEFGLNMDVLPLANNVTSCVLTRSHATGYGNAGLTSEQKRLLRSLAQCPHSPAPLAVWRSQTAVDGGIKVAETTFADWIRGMLGEYVVRTAKGHYSLAPAGLQFVNHTPIVVNHGGPIVNNGNHI